jgi:hypothetical protein
VSDIIEIYWDASPALRRLGIRKIGSGELDPKAEALFTEVKAAAASAFPGALTLVRIEVSRASTADLRVVRNGAEEPVPPGLRQLLEYAVEGAASAA